MNIIVPLGALLALECSEVREVMYEENWDVNAYLPTYAELSSFLSLWLHGNFGFSSRNQALFSDTRSLLLFLLISSKEEKVPNMYLYGML